jgi:hypothetical protein
MIGSGVFLIRESLRGDVDQVLAVAQQLDTVNLPADRDLIGSILELSELSFAGEIPREGRDYLFVMERSGPAGGSSMSTRSMAPARARLPPDDAGAVLTARPPLVHHCPAQLQLRRPRPRSAGCRCCPIPRPS